MDRVDIERRDLMQCQPLNRENIQRFQSVRAFHFDFDSMCCDCDFTKEIWYLLSTENMQENATQSSLT